MTEIKENDFIKVEFDIYANDKLVQTTNEKKGKEIGLEKKKYGPETIIIGKAFVLKALDDAIIKKKEDTLELTPEQAYGRRKKELIKTFPKSVFDEQKLRVIPGMVYDFNGTYGTVKSAVGGRVMVDFNNPLAGKNIKLEYKFVSKVEDIKEKIDLVMETILRLPKNMYEIKSKEKDIEINVPEQIVQMKDMLIKSYEEIIPEIKEWKVKIGKLEEKQKSNQENK